MDLLKQRLMPKLKMNDAIGFGSVQREADEDTSNWNKVIKASMIEECR